MLQVANLLQGHLHQFAGQPGPGADVVGDQGPIQLHRLALHGSVEIQAELSVHDGYPGFHRLVHFLDHLFKIWMQPQLVRGSGMQPH